MKILFLNTPVHAKILDTMFNKNTEISWQKIIVYDSQNILLNEHSSTLFDLRRNRGRALSEHSLTF